MIKARSIKSELKPWINLFAYRRLYSKGKIRRYKNIHKGETIVCVGCGPSLNLLPQDIFSRHPCIYLNSAFQINSQLSETVAYSLVQDHNRLKELKDINRSDFKASFRCAYDFTSFNINCIDRKNDTILMPKLKFVRSNLFYKPQGVIDEASISQDLSKEVNLIGYTVMFTAIQLAIWMGARNILLAGYDVDYSSPSNLYFNQSNLERVIWVPDYRVHMMPAALAVKKYADSLGVQIINININSKDLVFDKSNYLDFVS